MGDVFKNVSDAVIATRGSVATRGDEATTISNSQLTNCLNRIGETRGLEAQEALQTIASHLELHQSVEAMAVFASFSQEAAKPDPSKPLLKALWNEFKDILPHASTVASAIKTVATLFL